MELIRVLLVDNEEVFREGLASFLKQQPHIEVVHQCASGKEAVEKARELKPDVVMLDSDVSDGNPTDILVEIKKHLPEVKVAMISRAKENPNPSGALKAGARAYLAKSIALSDLVKSIELISSGRIIISPVFAEKFLEEISSVTKTDEVTKAEGESSLSAREIEIAKLVAQGATNKEIAEKLFIAESTVKVHVRSILGKLELRNRQQLAVYAVLRSWVTASSEGKDVGLAT